MDAEFWTAVGSVATVIGSLAAGIGLVLTGLGLRYAGAQLEQSKQVAKDAKDVAEESKNIAQGEFLLRLDELFQQHIEVHRRLRPGGDWANAKSGPQTNDDWVDVEKYMGLFERIQFLVSRRIIDIDIIDKLYGYRLFNIVSNPIIRKNKLEQEADAWQDFIALWRALEAHQLKRS